MPTTPSAFSPVTLSRAWSDIFEDLDQWDDVEKFYALHARDLNTVQGHRRMCSSKVAHLLALFRSGAVQLVHHIHMEDVDDFRSDNEGEIWALTGAGGMASMVYIGERNAYVRRQGKPNDWRTMAEWKTRDDVTQSADRLRVATNTTTAAAGRPQATSRKGKARSVVTARTRTPRGSTSTMTPKMKGEYRKGLAVAASSEEGDTDDEDEEADENADPTKDSGGKAGVTIPNMIPVPAFVAVAIMKAYAIDAVSLCLATVEAIKERATQADEDYKTSANARTASYVAVWLWNVARDRSDRPNGIRIGPVMNPNADEWSRNCHLKFLAQKAAAPEIADSTTGLSDKDVKRLTHLKHVVPRNFHELSLLMKNLAGVTALVFGGASPLTSMLNGWVRFLTVSGGSVVSGLRHLAAIDRSAPSRVGWFVDRRIQQYLTACASCDHADLVDLDLFDFRDAR